MCASGEKVGASLPGAEAGAARVIARGNCDRLSDRVRVTGTSGVEVNSSPSFLGDAFPAVVVLVVVLLGPLSAAENWCPSI
jgi:hypothetical protein